MKSNYSREVSAIIAILLCYSNSSYCKNVNGLLSNNVINWDEFHRLANQHSIHLPIFHVFTVNQIKNIPTSYTDKLNRFQNFFFKRNKLLLGQLLNIHSEFVNAGLNPIPYKGLPFAKQFYGTIFHRTSVDIDFALDIEHFEKAKEVMLCLGYEEFKSKIDHDTIESSRAYYLDYPFVKRNAKGNIVFNVEFHWTPSHQILNIPIRFKEFAHETEKIKLGQHEITTFNKVHQALFAVIHHGNIDCWGKLKHLVDFALILKVLNEKELDDLEALCKKYKIYNSLLAGKALVNQILLNKENSEYKVPTSWANDIVNGSLAGKWSDNKMKIYYFLKSRDTWSDTLSSLYSILKYQLLIKPKIDELA